MNRKKISLIVVLVAAVMVTSGIKHSIVAKETLLEKTIQEKTKQAESLAEETRYEEAIAAYSEIIEEYGENEVILSSYIETLDAYGKYLTNAKQYDQAVVIYNSLYNLSGNTTYKVLEENLKKINEVNMKLEEQAVILNEYITAQDYTGLNVYIRSEEFLALADQMASDSFMYSIEENQWIGIYRKEEDVVGIYKGEIAEEKRNGTGLYFYVLEDTEDKYVLLENGTWQEDRLTGENTYVTYMKLENQYYKTTITGTYKDGLENGLFQAVVATDMENMEFSWSSVDGIRQEIEIPQEIESEYQISVPAEGVYVISYYVRTMKNGDKHCTWWYSSENTVYSIE